MASRVLTVWDPEDKEFWEREGKAIANRNLWISIPRSSWPLRSGWSGAWWSLTSRPSGSDSTPTGSSGSPRCPAWQGRRSASSTPSWCRSSGTEMDHPQHRLPADSGDRMGFAVRNPETGYSTF